MEAGEPDRVPGETDKSTPDLEDEPAAPATIVGEELLLDRFSAAVPRGVPPPLEGLGEGVAAPEEEVAGLVHLAVSVEVRRVETLLATLS